MTTRQQTTRRPSAHVTKAIERSVKSIVKAGESVSPRALSVTWPIKVI